MTKLFIIEKRETITLKDTLYLRNLYQPIIGQSATMLYQLFLDYYYLNKTYQTYFHLDDLALILGINTQDLLLCKTKLEAVGLIRTFIKNDQKHLIIILNKPLGIEKFVKNSLLHQRLIQKVGEEMWERISFAFKKQIYDKKDCVEVTSKFQNVFPLKDIKNYSQSTLEMNLPQIKSKEEALQNLTISQFIYYLTNKTPSPSLIKIINEIQQLGFASYSVNLIINYSFEVNHKIVGNHIRKIATSFYQKSILGFDAIKRDLESARRYRTYGQSYHSHHFNTKDLQSNQDLQNNKKNGASFQPSDNMTNCLNNDCSQTNKVMDNSSPKNSLLANNSQDKEGWSNFIDIFGEF